MNDAQPRIPAAAYKALGTFRCAMTEFDSASDARVREGGLTPQQYALLVMLGGEEAVSVGEVARELHITHNSAVGLSQRAEKAGLLMRAPDPARGHRTLLRLTGEGARKLDAVTRVLVAQLGTERGELAEALSRWDVLLRSGRFERAFSQQPSPEAGEAFAPEAAPPHEVRPARRAEKTLLWHLLQLHLHDLSAYRGGAPDERGVYPYAAFDSYWQEEERRAYVLRLARLPAGFALVERTGAVPAPEHVIHELHVLRQYRGLGLGAALVGDLVRERPGRWSVTYPERNAPAASFWRETLRRHARGPVQEEYQVGAPPARRLTFDGPPA